MQRAHEHVVANAPRLDRETLLPLPPTADLPAPLSISTDQLSVIDRIITMELIRDVDHRDKDIAMI